MKAKQQKEVKSKIRYILGISMIIGFIILMCITIIAPLSVVLIILTLFSVFLILCPIILIYLVDFVEIKEKNDDKT